MSRFNYFTERDIGEWGFFIYINFAVGCIKPTKLSSGTLKLVAQVNAFKRCIDPTFQAPETIYRDLYIYIYIMSFGNVHMPQKNQPNKLLMSSCVGCIHWRKMCIRTYCGCATTSMYCINFDVWHFFSCCWFGILNCDWFETKFVTMMKHPTKCGQSNRALDLW